MSKYKFNKDQLRFVEDKLGIRGKTKLFITYFFVSILLAILYYIIFASLINTKEEELVIKQNKLMEQELKKVNKKMDNLDNVLVDLQKRDKIIYKSIFKANPPDFVSNGYNSNLFDQIDSSRDLTLVKFTTEKIDTTQILVEDQNKKIDQIFIELKKAENLLNIPSIIPIRSLSITQTGASIGKKIHPFYKTATNHTGLDLLAAIGTEVHATADGVVRDVVKSDKGRGNQVIIVHNGDYTTSYSHLGDILVRKSQIVKRGTVIARVGNSGLSFAPHLHYEVIFKGETVEPINYFFADLWPAEYKEMLIIAINSGQSLD